MASFFDKVKIKTATEEFNKFDLSCDHITTTDWMHLSPIYNKEMVPKEKLSINVEAMTRLAPMSVPTFGRGNINIRAFFVPYRTIFPGWNDFISDVSHMPHNQASGTAFILTTVPRVSNTNIRRLFVNDDGSDAAYGLATSTSTVPSSYDFVLQMNSTSTVYYITLTAKGRRIMKIIESLGYKIIWHQTDNYYSALPILAYAKVYCDWYWPQAYPEATSGIENLFKQDSSSTFDLSSNHLWSIFTLADLVSYDSDYFTAAWDNPVGPNNGGSSSFSLVDVTNQNNSGAYIAAVTNNTSSSTAGLNNNTPVLINNGTSNKHDVVNVTQYALDALKSLTDYMKRHQLAGAKALDRFFARFGTVLPAEKLNRSVYIGSKLVPLQFGDVTSQTDTTGINATNDPYGYDRLGAFAGRGLGYGQGNFDFETDEYGMLIICSSCVPSVGYYQGFDRTILHMNKTDFWTPEFDQLGTQAIATGELNVPKDGQLQQSVNLVQNIFGYTPRYAEYKIGRDKVTGDYRYDTMNKSLMTNNGWHFMREFPEFLSDTSNTSIYQQGWLTHSSQFVQGTDAQQYNRIFQSYAIDENKADHFSVIYHFDVGMNAPMKSLWDTYDFDSKGKEVTEDVNGVKMN